MRRLYEKIFGGENYGKFHCDLCMLNLRCLKIAANIKCYDEALEFFDSVYVHYMEFLKLQNEDCFEDDRFNTPLLSAVGNTSIPVIMCKAEYLKDSLSYLPEDIRERIMSNLKYTVLH